LEDLSRALQKSDAIFRAFRGSLSSEDYMVVDISPSTPESASLTLIQGGIRCLRDTFATIALEDAISDLMKKNK